ncbi:MAG: FtsW/RodA/SpoVE family cell cycle protein [Pelagibacterales bacterium]|nr:FtsW/RodA/SpoVE family cell cycle protein [Pelagibacterales bacterium]
MLFNNSFYKFYYSWWKNINKSVLFLIIILFGFGLFFSLVSTSLIASDKLDTNSYYFFFKHFTYIGIGVFTIILFSSLNHNDLIKISKILFVLCLFFLILVPIAGVEVKGSKRWIDFIFFPRFQPIELLKPFLIVIIAHVLSYENKKNIYYKYFLSFLIIIPVILLLIAQPDIGQSFLIFLTWLSLIFISGINLIIFFVFFGLVLILLIAVVFFFPNKFGYILIRLKSFFDPTSGNNYQSEKASEAIINGGFFGKGIGEGTLKNRIPEAHTDYIVSVISEEFGVLFIILLMIIFLFLVYQVFKELYFEKDNQIKLILVGSISIILLQALIHIGVNIRLFPTTGMTLPYISYGGSSIISTSILSGIIINLTKRKISY